MVPVRVSHPRTTTSIALVFGVVAVVAATLAGANGDTLDAIAHPPPLIRAALVGGCAVLALVCLSRGLTRLAVGMDDVPGLVRGVRWIFLAVAAVAAGAGWVVGNALPLVVALVIAGVDVIETSFLLLVVGDGQVNRTS
jgi:hypothetical protein